MDDYTEHLDTLADCYGRQFQKRYRKNLPDGVIEALSQTESPIETRMLMALVVISLDAGCMVQVHLPKGGWCTIYDVHDGARLRITPQWKYGRKRVDLHIEYGDAVRADDGSVVDYTANQLLVECDGHDYHERTKEQASRDRRRDREFLAAGFRVMRFTGSEIYNNDWADFASEIIHHLKGKEAPVG